MPGSVGNPVVLDPFRTIVEVGWSKLPEYIRILVPVEMISGAGGQDACPAEYPDEFPYTGSFLTETYLTAYSVENSLTEDKPYALTATGYWRNKSEELTVDSGEFPVTITGVPDGPFIDEELDGWTYVYAALGGSGGHGTRITGLTAAEFSDPDYPDLPTDFYEATTQDLDLVAHEITSPPACGYEDPGPPPTNYRPFEAAPHTGTGSNPDLDIFFGTAAVIASGALNFATVAVSYRGETYSPVAISGSEDNEYEIEDGDYSVSVLCKRVSSES